MKQIAFSFILTAMLLCSCGSNTTKSEITAEMAYEGVSNYCHSAYDWSIAKKNRYHLLIAILLSEGLMSRCILTSVYSFED